MSVIVLVIKKLVLQLLVGMRQLFSLSLANALCCLVLPPQHDVLAIVFW